ncbi:MAG: PilN domain-containing protein [Pseudomonadales bacterium]
MARINLLPWREWERERKRKEFLGNLAGVFVGAIVLVLAAGWYLDGEIENQQSRNGFLEREIAVLDEKILEIQNLQKTRDELLARMRVIQELQGNRPVIVRIFDELVRTLAKGVHFKKLDMKGNRLTVDGVAESNNRISSLMRNLDNSDWFASPNLKTIKEDPKNVEYGAQASTFNLTFVQTNPNKVVDDQMAQGAQ